MFFYIRRNLLTSSSKSSIKEDIIHELAQVVRYNYEIDTVSYELV